MTEENKLKTQAIALIDAQEKFKKVNLQALENAVDKYRIALQSSEPAKQEVVRLIKVIRESCGELDDVVCGEMYDSVRQDKELYNRYWEAQDCYDSISDSLSPVKMKYAYEAEDLVDWSSSEC